jgi:hypothetical protein
MTTPSKTFTAAHSPKQNILAEEAVLPTLHNLILVEVYLSGGPVDIFRLWAEMYERQKTIDVGLLLFIRAIMHLEENGFLAKASEMRSGITGQGEMYLMALLLVDELSDEALERLANRGLVLASAGGVA